MPEFLFRRRKQQNRRNKDASNDAQEPEGAVQGAKEPAKKKEKDKMATKSASGATPAAIPLAKEVERNESILREKEEFMALYKNKYPEDAARLGLTNRTRDLEMGGAAHGGGAAMMNGGGAVLTNHANGSDHLAPLVSLW